MRPYDPKLLLIGIHIPKCAGSSMKQVLRRWFGRNIHWHFYDEARNLPPRPYRPSKFNRLLTQVTGRVTCIYGPFNRQRGFGVEEYYPTAQQFFTVVRDPLKTALSRYFYAKQQGLSRMHAGIPAPISANYASVDDFIADQLHLPYLVNYLPGPLTLGNYADVFAARFVYVGIAEDLQTSVDQLAERLGFASVPVPHVNTSKHDETLDPALAADFVAARPLEYAIYHYALEHYRDVPST